MLHDCEVSTSSIGKVATASVIVLLLLLTLQVETSAMATKRKTVDDPGLGSRKRRSVTEGVDDDRSLADNHSNGTKINAASSNDKPAVGHSGMNKHVVNLFTTKENLVHFLDAVNSANVEFMGVEGDAIPRQQQCVLKDFHEKDIRNAVSKRAYADNILKLGGVTNIVTALTSKDDDALEKGLNVVISLMSFSDDVKRTFIQVGVADYAIEAMKTRTNNNIQKQASVCLLHLIGKEETQQYGGPSTLVCELLSDSVLKKKEGVDAIIGCMKSNFHDVTIQANGCCVLRYLCQCEPTAQVILRSDALSTAAMGYETKKNDDVGLACYNFLRLYLKKKKARTEQQQPIIL